ncbi:IclR family transcriptional regulator [Corynebacterium sp. L4756]|uniref:IclR family transcriptional regulator n=1 Tax=unclassified Corynebacterium TaxID=2624378 RepID=UPI00374DCCC7
MGDYSAVSGIKVLDRAVAIMMAAANKPSTLNDLCETTGLPRATAHRLATALEAHRLVARTAEGKWTIGPAFPGNRDDLLTSAKPIMKQLMEDTGESIQLYQWTDNARTCVAAQEPAQGLHNVVPVGSQLPLTSGSAARIIAAFADITVPNATFTTEDISHAKNAGYSESVEEREAGLASVSAPVTDSNGQLVAVLSISGSVDRFKPSPAEKFGTQLLDAAAQLSAGL